MGQKIHPEGFRVGYIHDWKSNWFNEREFADYIGVAHAVAVSQGTAAIQLALQAIGVAPGDEVTITIDAQFALQGE